MSQPREQQVSVAETKIETATDGSQFGPVNRPLQSVPALIAAYPGKRVRGVFMRVGLPMLLLTASILTTTGNGARFMQNFKEGLPPVVRDSDLWPWPWLLRHPELFWSGAAFSFTLLGILLTHEFGHYLACRAHKISATLPWVIPAPTLSGTAGAVIQLRSRIPDRAALMDVGIYGPLAGYGVSALAVAIGFELSHRAAADAPAAIVRFGGQPLTLRMIHGLLAQFDPSLPAFAHIAPHPVLVAGWIGLFITSLNLIPGGQLDGGHILYAISPRLHRISTKALPFVLLAAGAVYWLGWMLWGVILMLPAMRHPQIAAEPPLHRGRVALGVLGLLVLVLTFTASPFNDNSLLYFLGWGGR